MLIALPYSHGDTEQTLKLIKWIGFLSEQNGGDMQKETLMLVPSIMASQRQRTLEIIQTAESVFKNVIVHVPAKEDERGWPQSCNAMFAEALTWVEANAPDDMFLVEPDAIPIQPGWYGIFHEEYDNCGKPFMGGLVGTEVTHMTGVAIYARDWRKHAPSLIENTTWPWDVHSAKEVVKKGLAHFTRKIQHVNRRPELSRLENVWPEALIYHQDKVGTIIDQLDVKVYGGAFSRHHYFKPIVESVYMPMKFFFAENTMQAKRHGAFVFRFENVGNFGGAWQGVYATDDEQQIIALNSLAADPKTSVREISADEYEQLAKKKAPTSKQPALSESRQRQQLPPEAPGAFISGKKALVVEENPLPLPDNPTAVEGPIVEDVRSIIKTGIVSQGNREADKPRQGRPRKSLKKEA